MLQIHLLARRRKMFWSRVQRICTGVAGGTVGGEWDWGKHVLSHGKIDLQISLHMYFIRSLWYLKFVGQNLERS